MAGINGSAVEAVRECAHEIIGCVSAHNDDPTVGRERIIAAIQKLLRHADLFEVGLVRKTNHGDASKILYYDPKLMMVLGDTRKDRGDTQPHNHGVWLASAVYKGQVRYREYSRADDMKTPGIANLNLVEDRVLNPGDVGLTRPPPHDIHQLSTLSDSYNVMVVTGGGFAPMRQYYDVERGTYVETLAGRGPDGN